MATEKHTLSLYRDETGPRVRITNPHGNTVLDVTLSEWSRMVANPHTIPNPAAKTQVKQ